MESKQVTIEVEFNLYTVKTYGRLVHNLTLRQAVAIAELYLQSNNFPSVIIVYEQTFDDAGELMFVEHCVVKKVITLDKQYSGSCGKASGTSFTLSAIRSLI